MRLAHKRTNSRQRKHQIGCLQQKLMGVEVPAELQVSFLSTLNCQLPTAFPLQACVCQEVNSSNLGWKLFSFCCSQGHSVFPPRLFCCSLLPVTETRVHPQIRSLGEHLTLESLPEPASQFKTADERLPIDCAFHYVSGLQGFSEAGDQSSC